MSRGRGRGRGRGKQFGGLESLHPGEPPPPPILTPPPLYPPMEKRPLELRKSQVDTYLLTVKQSLRDFMRQSPFSLKAGSEKKEIERYSDKYKQFRGSEIDNFIEWRPDWKFFPEELQVGVKRRKRPLVARPNVLPAKKRMRTSSGEGEAKTKESDIDVGKKKVTFADDNEKYEQRFTVCCVKFSCNRLDSIDETVTGLKGEKSDEEREGEGEEGEGVAEEVYEEEIEEEDTDYNMTYFDNGEDYGGDEDETLEEGPCY